MFTDLTHPQKRIFQLEQLYHDTGALNVMGCMYFKEELDISLLDRAINEIILKNDAVRIRVFKYEDNHIKQRIGEYSYRKIEVVNFKDKEEEYKEWIGKEASKPFEFYDSDLYKFWIAINPKGECGFVLKFHHIISDAWSIVLSANEIWDNYKKLRDNVELTEKNESYLNYVESEKAYKTSKRFKKDKSYWEDKFKDFNEYSLFLKNEEALDVRALRITKKIEGDLYLEVQKFCKENNISIFNFLSTNAALALKCFSGRDNISLGTAILNRTSRAEQKTLGMFISTMVVRLNMKEDMSYIDTLNIVKDEILSGLRHQKYPYDILIDDLRENYGVNNKLYDVTISYQNATLEKSEEEEYKAEWIFNKNSFDPLTMHINDRNNENELTIDYDYQISLLNEKDIEIINNIMFSIIKDGIKDINKKIKEISYVSEEEKHNIIYKFNNKNSMAVPDKSISKLFEEMVLKCKDKTAVIEGDKEFTYDRLNRDANRLANYLYSKGIKKGINVPIRMDRSYSFLVSILAVLKCGAAYVPVDLGLPDERVNYILKHCEAEKVLISSDSNKVQGYENINIEDIDLNEDSSENLEIYVSPEDKIYIIYTSGTTGNPKGVVLAHKNVVSYITFAIKQYVQDNNGNMPLFTSISFDLTVTSLFVPLLSGNTLIVYKEDKNINSLMEDVFKDDRIDIIKLTPAHLKIANSFVDFNKDLKCFILGGEELKTETAKETYLKYDKNIKIFNEYGPTETAVGCMIYEYDINKDKNIGVSIGKPIDNTSIYILDKNFNIMPIGLPGELCVAGLGVGLGYLNNKELSDEKFFKNPYSKDELIYRTGDLAVLNEDGNFEYLGRIDNQVKIRGFRIELGEIEKALMQYEGIKEAVVIKVEMEKGQEALGAFYVSNEEIEKNKLKEYLLRSLPKYMIPLYYVKIDKIPLSYNGKVEPRLLPKLTIDDMVKRSYEKPENEVEERLVSIWENVLNVKGIGVRDDFFELGGHSLKVVEAVNKINESFNSNIKVNDIFENPSIRELGGIIKLSKAKKPFEKAEDKEFYEMSYIQKSIYTICSMDKENLKYNMPYLFNIEGSINVHKLEDSFKKLIKRYESLRTNFDVVNGVLVQDIKEDVFFKVKEIHLDDNEEIDNEKLIEKIIKPFDLAKDTLIRAVVIYKGKNAEKLFIDTHHIISDGETTKIYLKDLMDIYNDKELEKVFYQYKDFSEYSNDLIEGTEIEEEKKFWKESFEGEIPVLNMTADYERGGKKLGKGGKASIVLESDLIEKIEKIKKENKLTSFMFMFGSFGVLLNKYTNQNEYVIGIPYLGRNLKEFENITGMFVNSLPIKVKISQEESVKNYFKNVKNTLLNTYSNSDLPFERIVNLLNVQSEKDRNPLFDVMFTMESDISESLSLGEAKLVNSNVDCSIEKFDMTLQVFEDSNSSKCQISYSTELFKKETMENFLNYYKNALVSLVDNFENSINEVTILSEDERLGTEFNKEIKPLDKDLNVIKLFEESVKRTPKKGAVYFKDEKLTYAELNVKVNRRANELRAKGVKRNDIVGLILDKSIEMIVSIFAVIKSGAAYLPIDTSNPEDRIKFILSDSNAKFVITSDKYAKYVEKEKYINVDIEPDSIYSSENLEIINSTEDTAYVIYTSGSTGTPKGVLLSHRNVVSIAKESNIINMTEKDKVLQLCNYAFDVSVAEIMCSLLNSAELFVMEKDDVMNINKVSKVIKENNISFIFTTTAIFNLIVDTNIDALESIRRISIGGEKASVYHLNKGFKRIGKGKLLNAYGPTEATVITTGYIINELMDESRRCRVPIGKGVDYSRLYVLDENNNIKPRGAVGELVVGGLGVALRYLNREDLTKERFIDSPFVKGDRLYKTGDLVRLLPNGDIDFIDRIDNQVKIRGYRIELSGITNKIMEHREIRNAEVIADTDDNNNVTRIIAYVVTDSEENIEKLKTELQIELPSYMIPSDFIKIDKMPLTNNGKVDKKKLPKPDKVIKKKDISENEADELQFIVIEVWKEVLGVSDIGINDNFFELGGDSIKAIQVVSKLQKRNKFIDVKTLMSVQTIKELSPFIEDKEVTIDQCKVVGRIEITPVMKEFINDEGNIYNVLNQGIVLRGKERFDEEVIRKSLDRLCEHHDILRASIVLEDSIHLYNHDTDIRAYNFETVEIDDNLSNVLSYIDERIRKIQTTFDVTKNPLIKLVLFRCKDEDHLLILAHHLIIDGVSWRIFLEDFSELYKGLKNGNKVNLQSKTSSFKEWSLALENYSKSDEVKDYEFYWNKVIDENVDVKLYKEDFNRTLNKITREEVVLTEEETESFLNETKKVYNTDVSEMLLAALALSFNKAFDSSSFYVSIEGHGREQIREDIDITRTIGWFTSIYPVYLDITGCKDMKESIVKVKETMRNIPNSGFDYQVFKHFKVSDENKLYNKENKCQFGFNYLGNYGNTDYGIFEKSIIEVNGSFGDDVKQKNPIEINSLIVDGKLKLEFAYSEEEISKDLVKNLINEYKKYLNEITNLCMENKDIVYTVSDFDDDSLSEDDLSSILDLFN